MFDPRLDPRRVRARLLRSNNSSAVSVGEQSPSDLASLVAWGEGPDLGADGSSIDSWLNKTLSGLDPANTGTNRPTVKANAINGQKAALFTAASSQYLKFSGAALNWFQNVPGITMIAVVQPVSLAATQRLLYVQINGGVPSRASISLTATPNYSVVGRSVDATTTTAIAAGTPVVGTPHIIANLMDASGGAFRAYLDGAQIGATQTTPAQNTSNTASDGIGIGAIATTGGNPLDAYVAAYAMWNVAYTRSQLAGVLKRWARIYGITLTG